MLELDLGHPKEAAPLRLVPQTILERTARVLLTNEEFYRSRVVKPWRDASPGITTVLTTLSSSSVMRTAKSRSCATSPVSRQ